MQSHPDWEAILMQDRYMAISAQACTCHSGKSTQEKCYTTELIRHISGEEACRSQHADIMHKFNAPMVLLQGNWAFAEHCIAS